MGWRGLDSYSSTLLSHGTLRMLHNLLRNPYQATIRQIDNQIPEFVYLLCALHVKYQHLISKPIDKLIVSPDTSALVNGGLC